MTPERKLATIVAADVAGYSRLMGENEEAALAVLKGHREVYETLLGVHRGRLFNTAGDAFLSEFASAVDAVRFATELQSAVRTRNDQLPPDRRMLFRIGINIGDVVIQGDDLLGDGVNVAARVQTAAEPGGICISGAVFDQIQNKLVLSIRSLGERAYKNLAQPVRTYTITQAEAGTFPTPAAGRKATHGGHAGRGSWLAAAAVAALAIGAGAWWFHDANETRRADAARAETERAAADEVRRKAEAERLAAERRAIEEARRRAEEERQRADAERRRIEEDRRRAEEERQRVDAERDRIERERRAAEEARQREEERRRTEAQRAEVERQRLEAERRAAEEERRRIEEDRHRAELQRLEAERRVAEEARQRAEEERRHAEAQRLEAERRAAEERQRTEAQRKTEEQSRRTAPAPAAGGAVAPFNGSYAGRFCQPPYGPHPALCWPATVVVSNGTLSGQFVSRTGDISRWNGSVSASGGVDMQYEGVSVQVNPGGPARARLQGTINGTVMELTGRWSLVDRVVSGRFVRQD